MVLTRFFHDGALSLVWGGLGYATCIAGPDLRQALVRRLAAIADLSVCITVATSAAAFPIQTADITAQWKSAWDLGTLHLVAETSVGQALAVQIATGVGLVVAVLVRAHRTSAAIAGSMLCELAFSGHAAEGSGFSGLIHQAIDCVHVLTGCAWLGALIPFMTVLRMSAVPELRQASLRAMKRFSVWGHVAVALVLISGLANIWLTLGRLPFDFTSPYDQKLILKIFAVGLMTSIAIANRYVLVPMIRKHNSSARPAMIYGCIAEIILGAFALGLVASFGLQDPA
ncbi:copper homeostasis membrane protein CopD [Rhizobium sp. HT1-10]|uniref:copper homeostasis membrane protein CopD n=1 Tax=Rhizobium sp. HT1-10 TaxID=3111638 RepID=UPI003C177DFD